MEFLITTLCIAGALLLFFQAKKEKQKKNPYAVATYIILGLIIIGAVVFYYWLSRSLISLFGFSSKNVTITEKIEPKFDVDMRIQDGSDITFTIQSNLPNETLLTADLRDVAMEKVYRVAKGEIMNGYITLGPFKNVEPGKYFLYIEVSMVLQKDSVKNILGSYGENLLGKLVQKNGDSNYVAATITFEIPEP